MKIVCSKVYSSQIDKSILINIRSIWGLKEKKHGIEEDKLKKQIERILEYLSWPNCKEHSDQGGSCNQAKIKIWNQQFSYIINQVKSFLLSNNCSNESNLLIELA